MQDTRLVTFADVSFEFGRKPILIEASFTLRAGSKVTLMGQNGAGKSTILNLITGRRRPESGKINIVPKTSIALARQAIPREELAHTVREFFEHCFSEKVHALDPLIDRVLAVVNLLPEGERASDEFLSRKVGSMSGGQQARLLLASALIQDPDILLLDEPTNNLDRAGIEHLTEFLRAYKKTVVVISHDAGFLNAFTDSVWYLNTQTHTVEQYDGNYNDVVAEITARVEREKRQNARMEREMQAKKDKANFFANKGGNLRAVAKRMREKAAEYEENKVEVRREDKTIRRFTIPVQEDVPPIVLTLSSVTVVRDHKMRTVKREVVLRKGAHLHIVGPNGIGKTTLLETLASGHAQGEHIAPEVRIGYYRQDFSNLDPNVTVLECLQEVQGHTSDQELRSIAAGFLIDGDLIRAQIGHLSEGQKGLVAFARLVLIRPGLLILDEPTNHINFRHIPVIAKALSSYEGAMLLVSHVPEFVKSIRIDEVLDLGKKARNCADKCREVY